ncbi:histone deacetylase family protein [Comamonas endophytica]|uniref:Histone deacetylase family protein n=1 Tax=Comamonas endophytica TaxID=2949090 RepID=A0ABY6G842_9BURK|nr:MULTISPECIES: histone deacetylase family protein [unclassified Acidovorax]MCD2511670.1 histone deacetylase family protein [Acidovorax sp. D4N7]UYG51051.1 histone deacetylase family protein [Acidovorax sp. 5MLIR]
MTVGKTGYFSHRECWKHEMGPGHPECPQRLDAIEDRLLICGVADALERRDAPVAALGDIARAHDGAYLQALQARCEQLEQARLIGGAPYAQIDPDTAINACTWKAALHAAGAGIAATDAVLSGELENAFCAVRPPGHHATRSQAMGFCFFNNVAIAALHALEHHGLERVAIVDFDVHHGNGTEDILAGDPRVLMVGVFQHPFFPFSGDQQPAQNMVNVPLPAYTKGMDIREIVEMMWIPRLEAFKPQMIFVSAGFDGHREDDMGQWSMNEQDYAWITGRVKDIARRFAKGRIVSCLEGGYAMSALGRSVEAHLRELADL